MGAKGLHHYYKGQKSPAGIGLTFVIHRRKDTTNNWRDDKSDNRYLSSFFTLGPD